MNHLFQFQYKESIDGDLSRENGANEGNRDDSIQEVLNDIVLKHNVLEKYPIPTDVNEAWQYYIFKVWLVLINDQKDYFV